MVSAFPAAESKGISAGCGGFAFGMASSGRYGGFIKEFTGLSDPGRRAAKKEHDDCRGRAGIHLPDFDLILADQQFLQSGNPDIASTKQFFAIHHA